MADEAEHFAELGKIDEQQALALMEAYTCLRAMYYAGRESVPDVANMCAESAASLMKAFPSLRQLESFIRLGEAELAIRRTDDEGQKGIKPS